MFESCIFREIRTLIDPFLSKFQCGFRKVTVHNNRLLATLEEWKPVVDKGKSFGALVKDLSKTFDCLSHELLLAKLHMT